MRLPSTLLIGMLLASGCAQPQREAAPVESQVGKNCIVYFRHDTLGMAADGISSATTGSINGAEVTQAGQLMKVGANWIVVKYRGREFHIPQASILMIEFGQNITQDPALALPVEAHAGDHKVDPSGHGGHEHH